MPTVRFALLTFVFAATALPLPAQVPPSNPVPTLTTTVRQVVLDVVVADKKGQPVKGVRPSDFILSEDGVPQTVVSFTENDAAVDPSPAPPAQLPANTFANHAPVTNNIAMTVIVFDTYNIDWESGYYARYEVAQYLKSVAPGTPLCIFKLDPRGLQLIQDFTTDAQTLKKAVESNRNAQWPPLDRQLMQNFQRGQALRQLASYLSSFPGRKNLIWFGGNPIVPGRPESFLPDIDTLSKAFQGVSDTLTLNRVALYFVDPRGLVLNPDEGAGIMMDAADLSKTVAPIGGKVFSNTNGLKEIVASVVASGSHYYTLAYTPTNTNWDGKFRKIKLQLANTGQILLANQTSGAPLQAPLHLEYRTGYFARRTPQQSLFATGPTSTRTLISYSPKGDPHRTAAEPTPLALAMNFGAVTPFQILFQAQITPAATTGKIKRNATRPKGNFLETQWLHKPWREQQIHYSIDAHGLQFTQLTPSAYHAELQLVAVVYDDTGTQVNSLVTTSAFDLDPDHYMRAMSTAIGDIQTIAVPVHGTFYLRLGVRDLDSGSLGAIEIPLESVKQLPTQASASTPKIAH